MPGRWKCWYCEEKLPGAPRMLSLSISAASLGVAVAGCAVGIGVWWWFKPDPPSSAPAAAASKSKPKAPRHKAEGNQRPEPVVADRNPFQSDQRSNERLTAMTAVETRKSEAEKEKEQQAQAAQAALDAQGSVDRRAGDEMLTAVEALDSAARSGLSHGSYSDRLADTHVKVDAFMIHHVRRGAFTTDVLQAMAKFDLAARFWSASDALDTPGVFSNHPNVAGETDHLKAPLRSDPDLNAKVTQGPEGDFLRIQDMLDVEWTKAHGFISRARSELDVYGSGRG